MLDEDKSTQSTPETLGFDLVGAGDSAAAESTPAKKTAAKKAAAKRPAAKQAPAKKATAARKAPAKKVAATAGAAPVEAAESAEAPPAKKTAAKRAPAKKAPAKKTAPRTAAAKKAVSEPVVPAVDAVVELEEAVEEATGLAVPPTMLLFHAPETTAAPQRTRKAAQAKPKAKPEPEPAADEAEEPVVEDEERGEDTEQETGEAGAARRRRRRGGRRRRKPGEGPEGEEGDQADEDEEPEAEAEETAAEGSDDETGEGAGTRRRRRRRRAGEDSGEADDDPSNTVTRVRQTRSPQDQITAVSGSTRLEAKKQRRREGREAGRRRAPIVSEAEFLARRESVERVMVIRQRQDLIQIAVIEDKVLVEHYVARESQTSLIGNVYVGRVQNVLPSMEAAFIDIGKGRNAVLYAGEVNWSALGHKEGQPRKIESVLSSGQSVLVQVTKDPIGHKGARLTSQISLAGRFLVYVPDGTTSGISRKLPDTERNRLKTLLKEIVPDTAGVIVRTAAEGASEEELTLDVERLKAAWEEIETKSRSGSAPKQLHGEPDLTLKVVRDLFTEDFTKLVIEGDEAWTTVQGYVAQVAPDLESRLEQFERPENGGDVFSAYRIDEQIAKGLDRKVWLPSGGSLIIDRTEAMTVVDVNTGKFTGSGGNLEETVTKNNLEAAEEVVRQLRLRDIGGIIVVDFIDMVLESNRDLVLRRLVECLGRDRTRHQVAEVTSLGLVQMTRKRIGTGLLEAFSETCEHCGGRGLTVHDMPIEKRLTADEAPRGSRRNRGRGQGGNGAAASAAPKTPSPADIAAAHPTAPLDSDDEFLDDQVVPEDAVLDEVETVAPAEAAVEPDALIETETTEPAETEPAGTPHGAEAVVTPEAPAAEQAETPAEPSEPAAPRVVTRTRRAASRPAGSASSAPAPVVVVAAEPAVPAAAVAAAVEPPKVTTRTRGRSASRAAGPAAADAAAVDGAVDGEAPHEESHRDLHVPIKKKGSRNH